MYNLQETYVDDADPWMGILAAEAFVVQSMYHSTKNITGQLVFGIDMTLPINHAADFRYIHKHKQTQLEKDTIRENTTRIDHNYRVVDQVMIGIKPDLKYKTLFKGMYEIV